MSLASDISVAWGRGADFYYNADTRKAHDV